MATRTRMTRGKRDGQIPVSECTLCRALPQQLTINFNADETVPRALARLEPVARTVTEETLEVESYVEVLRCPRCGTHYHSHFSRDDGHNFMDPTHHRQRIRRVTPDAALALLERFGRDGEEGRLALAPRRNAMVSELRTMLLEQTAPGLPLLRHAIESVIAACLTARDREGLFATVLRHPDPVVRADGASHLLHLGRGEREWGFLPSPKAITDPAREIVSAEDGLETLASVFVGVLRAPVRPALDAEGHTVDTHETAAWGLALVVEGGAPVHDDTIAMLVSLLAGRSRTASNAAWVLALLGKRSPADAKVLLERLEDTGLQGDANPHVSHLRKKLRDAVRPPAKPAGRR